MTTGYVQTLRHFHRDVRLFLVSAALLGLAWDGVRTVLFNLFILRLGYGPEFVGLVNGVGALSFALSCPIFGAMVTRWGSRRPLIGGLAVLAAGFGLLPLAATLQGDARAVLLFTSNIVCHLGLALNLVSGMPFIMAVARPRERGHVFSLHLALAPLAAIAGSLLGGVLPEALASLLGLPPESALAYGLPMLLSALALLVGVLVLLQTSPTSGPSALASNSSTPATGAEVGPTPWVLLILMAVIMAFRFGGRGLVTTFSNVYLDEALSTSAALIGALSAAAQLVAVPSALVAPLLVARWGSARTIFWGSLGAALSALPLALVPAWTAAGVGLIGSASLFSMSMGPLRQISQEMVTPRWRGTMSSAYMMGAGLAFSLTSLIGGFIIVNQGYQTLFLVGIGMATISALLFWAYFRVPRGELARSPTAGTEV
ncbi:MAG: MFS transporter [Anaerolineae bacterium]